MNDLVCKGRTGLSLALAAAMMLTGCATFRRADACSTEEMLTAAGFTVQPADTAERQQRLVARAPYQLESHDKDGEVVYTYADPDGCKCLYVGGPKEYSEYTKLMLQREIAEHQRWEARGGDSGSGGSDGPSVEVTGYNGGGVTSYPTATMPGPKVVGPCSQ
jgi:hypothetical protein